MKMRRQLWMWGGAAFISIAIVFAFWWSIRLETNSLSSSHDAQSLSAMSSVILYTDNCGLYIFPPTQAFDHPELRKIYPDGGDACQDIGVYLVGNLPIVAPDGKKMVVTSPGGENSGTWLIDFETNNLRQLLAEPTSPTWAPNSDRITYVLDDTLYTLSTVAPSQPQAIFSPAHAPFARWSPDGQWIATASISSDHTSQATFWVVSAMNHEVKELGTFPISGMELTPDGITWSPDSQSIATFAGWVLALNGEQKHFDDFRDLGWWPRSRPRLIADETVQVWEFSHDRQQLAFAKISEGTVSIFVINEPAPPPRLIGTISASTIQRIRWNIDDKTLVVGTNTGIWALSINDRSAPELLVKEGLLVDVVARWPDSP